MVETLIEIEHNLERLTLDILIATIDDFPLHYEMHIVGVLGPIGDFLRGVSCAIVCYHGHHHV